MFSVTQEVYIAFIMRLGNLIIYIDVIIIIMKVNKYKLHDHENNSNSQVVDG